MPRVRAEQSENAPCHQLRIYARQCRSVRRDFAIARYAPRVAQRQGRRWANLFKATQKLKDAAPIPTTTIAYYCDGETPDPIEQFASVTDNSYSLIWYDDDPKKGGTTLSSAPTIDVTINPGEVETVRKYYVPQLLWSA